MDKCKWEVKKALPKDADRWFSLLSAVKDDFYGLDLAKDKRHRAGVIKNMNSGTAIYIEDQSASAKDCPIIGAMTFFIDKNQITWLAVHPDYRKKGVASALMLAVLKELNSADMIIVKTFRDDDEYGKAACCFYKKHGFIEGETFINDRYPHPVQVFTKIIGRAR